MPSSIVFKPDRASLNNYKIYNIRLYLASIKKEKLFSRSIFSPKVVRLVIFIFGPKLLFLAVGDKEVFLSLQPITKLPKAAKNFKKLDFD